MGIMGTAGASGDDALASAGIAELRSALAEIGRAHV